MSDFEDHEGNGTAVDGFEADDNGGRGGEIEDQTDSKSQGETRDNERESSRSKDREREKGSVDRSRDRSKERSRDRDRERRSRHRDRSRDRGDRRDRGSRDPMMTTAEAAVTVTMIGVEMTEEIDAKRVSGFDMAPPASAMLAAGAAVTGQVPPPPPTLPPRCECPTYSLYRLDRHSVDLLSIPCIDAMTQQPSLIFIERLGMLSESLGGLSPVANEQPSEVRRPSDYNPSLAASLGPSQPSPHLNLAAVGLTPGASGGLEGPDRIFVGGLPYYFTEAQVRELLESFGALKGFDLVKDRETGNSKGYAFCVYQDVAVTDIACVALNGIKMGDKTLTVRRANQGSMQPKPEQESVLLHAQQQIAFQMNMFQPGPVATTVVCLTQVVTEDELKDDEEFEDIMEDMRQEGGKFGMLTSVVIPRPSPSGEPVPGLGKVFLKYVDTEGFVEGKKRDEW
ncbi:hypothetical protein HID58_031338 [Brassica napus]|uniref:RRM domain-containing protein n=1 Tax=Brassica napus TaxID=3708 RepID=A0ABQ7XG83_BRANA|nr:hypothetical protein HID58_031338 [Brassica napus]